MDTLLDPSLAETRVLFGMAEAEYAQRAQWRSSASVFRAIDEVLREAVLHPEVVIGPVFLRGDVSEFAVRAAVADLAVRLNIAENTVRNYGYIAATLRRSMPQLWRWFAEGEVSTQNAREAASLVVELPAQCWPDFDDQLLDAARTMTPPRFRAKARALVERLHPRSLVERHEIAAQQRHVSTEPDSDGMGWLHAFLPFAKLAQVTAQLDAAAFDLFRDDDETRTMSQLRADVLADLVIGDTEHSRVTLALTIPVMALLGKTDECAKLEGAGPIDLETARSLAADVPSITRLLTNPITSSVLQLDPTQYRATAALKRWLRLQHSTCDFPGCGRRAVNCDLDHTDAFPHGLTTAENLAPRCRKHHGMKHQTRWKVEQPPGAPRAVWTSPTGYVRESDPPPF